MVAPTICGRNDDIKFVGEGLRALPGTILNINVLFVAQIMRVYNRQVEFMCLCTNHYLLKLVCPNDVKKIFLKKFSKNCILLCNFFRFFGIRWEEFFRWTRKH